MLKKRYRDKKKDLHTIFLDLEKSQDKAPRDLIWCTLEKKCDTYRYIDLMQDMYNGAMTRVRTIVR